MQIDLNPGVREEQREHSAIAQHHGGVQRGAARLAGLIINRGPGLKQSLNRRQPERELDLAVLVQGVA